MTTLMETEDYAYSTDAGTLKRSRSNKPQKRVKGKAANKENEKEIEKALARVNSLNGSGSSDSGDSSSDSSKFIRIVRSFKLSHPK